MMPFSLDPPLARDAVLMVWTGTIVEASEELDAAAMLGELLGLETRARVLGCVETLPDPDDDDGTTGGRVDLVFAISGEDVARAALRRLQFSDIKWLSDCDPALYADSVRNVLFV